MNLLEEIIFPAIDEFNEILDVGEPLDKKPDTLLFGMDSTLDSMNLVTLVTLVEEHIEDRLGHSLVLASDRAMAR